VKNLIQELRSILKKTINNEKIVPIATLQSNENFLDLLNKQEDPVLKEQLSYLHPAIKNYILANQKVFHFAETILEHSKLDKFYNTLQEINSSYSFPLSPITPSIINQFLLFDLKIDGEGFSMAEIFLRLQDLIEIEENTKKYLTYGLKSSLGFYRHMGFKDGFINLKEIISGKNIALINPDNYKGLSGQIWLTRMIDTTKDFGYQVLSSTPYIIQECSELDCLQYFESIGIEKNKKNYLEEYRIHMKLPASKNLWLEYIISNHMEIHEDHIYLSKIIQR